MKPDLVEALCALGDAYNSFDKGEMGLPLFEKALRVDRDHPMARLGLPRALASLGRMDEAAVHLKETIDRRIAVPAAYSVLVRTHKFTEEPPELAAILTELQDPDHGSEGVATLHHRPESCSTTSVATRRRWITSKKEIKPAARASMCNPTVVGSTP
ncbi:hypothetical protein AJ88_07815 [Mesorhizobium amorphae CCBAU 01583]|nr:hypothetical protein AJ88_07815 [Mesorhizobium amorphae CCBAU 01583]